MKIISMLALVAVCHFISPVSVASDRPAHFQAETINSEAEARVVLEKGNQQLVSLITAELTATSMTAIHELTYTLENALKLIPAATPELKAALEEVHLGSELMDKQRVTENATRYLALINPLLN